MFSLVRDDWPVAGLSAFCGVEMLLDLVVRSRLPPAPLGSPSASANGPTPAPTRMRSPIRARDRVPARPGICRQLPRLAQRPPRRSRPLPPPPRRLNGPLPSAPAAHEPPRLGGACGLLVSRQQAANVTAVVFPSRSAHLSPCCQDRCVCRALPSAGRLSVQ